MATIPGPTDNTLERALAGRSILADHGATDTRSTP